jgi:hypothetical protein
LHNRSRSGSDKSRYPPNIWANNCHDLTIQGAVPISRAQLLSRACQKCQPSIEDSLSSANFDKSPTTARRAWRQPDTLAKARLRPDTDEWEKAIKNELATLERNKTWEPATLPEGREPVGCRWVFRIKKKADGSLNRYKARLVAQGFSQIPGLDFEETFAPVAKLTSFREILAVATIEDWNIHQMDVGGAYLNGELEEEIYMRMPEVFNVAISRAKKYPWCLFSLVGNFNTRDDLHAPT